MRKRLVIVPVTAAALAVGAPSAMSAVGRDGGIPDVPPVTVPLVGATGVTAVLPPSSRPSVPEGGRDASPTQNSTDGFRWGLKVSGPHITLYGGGASSVRSVTVRFFDGTEQVVPLVHQVMSISPEKTPVSVSWVGPHGPASAQLPDARANAEALQVAVTAGLLARQAAGGTTP